MNMTTGLVLYQAELRALADSMTESWYAMRNLSELVDRLERIASIYDLEGVT